MCPLNALIRPHVSAYTGEIDELAKGSLIGNSSDYLYHSC
jgi:hypothetical protein